MDDDNDEEVSMDFCIQHKFEAPVESLKYFAVSNIESLSEPHGGKKELCIITPQDGAEGKVCSIYLRFISDLSPI